MVKSKEEILAYIKSKIGEDTSDDALSFIENLTDTFNDYDEKINNTTDWKSKYEENDKEWRKKYRDRFLNSGTEGDAVIETTEEDDAPKTKTKYEELFKTEEE